MIQPTVPGCETVPLCTTSLQRLSRGPTAGRQAEASFASFADRNKDCPTLFRPRAIGERSGNRTRSNKNMHPAPCPCPPQAARKWLEDNFLCCIRKWNDNQLNRSFDWGEIKGRATRRSNPMHKRGFFSLDLMTWRKAALCRINTRGI